MKRIFKTLFITLLAFALFGCSTPNKEVEPEQPWPTEVTYSNLSDEAARNLLIELMNKADISDHRQEVLFEHIDQINSLLEPNELSEGLKPHPIKEPLYDPYDLQTRWDEQYPLFFGYNCRITAFTVIS